MDQYRAADGRLGDWHLMHLGQFAKSGAGLLITDQSGLGRAPHSPIAEPRTGSDTM